MTLRKLALIPAALGATALVAATLTGASAGGAPAAPADEPVNAVALTAPEEPATSGFAETLDVDDDTQLVGLKWNGSEEPQFTIEVQREDGSWTAPYPAEPMDIGPDEGTPEAHQVRGRRGADHMTDALSVDGSEQVRVRMGDGLATDVELVAIGGDAPEPTGEAVPPPPPPTTAASTSAPPASTAPAPSSTTTPPPAAPSDPPAPPTGPEATQSSALTVTGIGLLALAAIAGVAFRGRDRRRVRRRGVFVVIVSVVALAASGCGVGAKGPATGPAPWPGVFGRAHWGAPDGPPCSGYTSNVRFSVVHHTGGGPADNNYTNAAAKIHGIWQYHLATGYCDIAYNFLVDKYGTLWEGRAGGVDQSVMGAHSAGFNTASTGVAILGDFTSVNAPGAAQDALVRLLAWKLWVHHVDPYTAVATPNGAVHPIAAHRETYPTSCPGDSFYPSMDGIRAEVGRRVFYGNPRGLLDSANRSGNQVTVAGWALDPDTLGPIDIHIYVGNDVYVRKANNLTRDDVAGLYPGYGSQHGYQYTVPAPPGATQVCVYAINVHHGNSNAPLGCMTV